MKVSSIDEYGSVLLTFSKPLQPIRNISLINDSVLIVNVSSPAKKNQIDNRNLSLTWQSVEMTTYQLKLKLRFAQPIVVSTLQVDYIDLYLDCRLGTFST